MKVDRTNEILKKAVDSSGWLRRLLFAVLDAGNFLNENSFAGNASGFRISALELLRGYRSIDQKSDLQRIIAECILKNSDSVAQFRILITGLYWSKEVDLGELEADIESFREKHIALKSDIGHLKSIDGELALHGEEFCAVRICRPGYRPNVCAVE